MTTASQPKECPICCDTIKNAVELQCCKTQFCMKCLDGWRLGLDHYIRGNRTCPCCRALIPPTQDVMYTIAFYKEVSLSIQILMQDPFITNLPVPPFSNLEDLGQVAIRHYYENMENVYGQRVRRFQQKYGATPTIIPSSPSPPIHFPVSLVQAIRANDYLEFRRFFGHLPIPPQRLNATCPSCRGNTMLHIAVQANNLDMVNVLLALGANPNSTNADHLTPLFYAVKIQGNDDRVAKALIRSGAKKVSMIFPTPSLNSGSNKLLAATADVLGKSELSRMLERVEARGRHCKVRIKGISRRGTIKCVAGDSHHILLDGIEETRVVATAANVEICKPLLFDFRGINRNVLFPSLSPGRPRDDPPGQRVFLAVPRPGRPRDDPPAQQLFYLVSAGGWAGRDSSHVQI